MLLVKKCIFFLYLFSVKIRQEIMFNNVLHNKETFFAHKKFRLSKSQRSFQRGPTHSFGQKMWFFSLFVFGQIRLEIMFNNVLHKKETFFAHKKFRLSKSQKSYFSKAVNQFFWSKNVIVFFICFRSNKARNNV